MTTEVKGRVCGPDGFNCDFDLTVATGESGSQQMGHYLLEISDETNQTPGGAVVAIFRHDVCVGGMKDGRYHKGYNGRIQVRSALGQLQVSVSK